MANVMNTLEDCDLQTRKELVRRVVSSSLICKSARLRELFLYLCNKVLDESVYDIHELELGHKVFGRPQHYDTAADNIVRVHASLLRKRLAEYFQTEGINETLVVEIPRGNYAPTFRKRDPLPVLSEGLERPETLVFQPDLGLLELKNSPRQQLPANSSSGMRGSKLLTGSFLALGLAALIAYLLVRTIDQSPQHGKQPLAKGTAVRQFWSGIFHQDANAQIVLDDASLDFYQEAAGHPVSLAEYFDRSYLLPAEEVAAAAHLDPKLVHSFLLKRQSNFADVNLVSRLSQTAGALGSSANLVFARDFSFRQVKSGNVILLGTRQSNPWIQSFDSRLALRWKLDPAIDSYYPTDSTANPSEPNKFRPTTESSGSHEGYASVAFLPNLGGTGNALILSGTGGAALGAALGFLHDEPSMSQLRSQMKAKTNAKENDGFPYFETLLRVEKGASLPRNVTIVMSRSPQTIASHDSQTAYAQPKR